MRKFLACSFVGALVFGGVLAACSGGGSGGSQSAFCDTLKKDAAQFAALNNNSDFTNSSSLQLVTKVMDDLAKKAPAEIKQDMQTLDAAMKELAAAMPDFSKAASQGDFSKLESLGSEFSDKTKNAEQASANVEKFAKEKCGIDLTSGSSSSSSAKSSSKSSTNFSDLSSLSDLSKFSDLSNLSDLSSLTDELSSLSSLFSS